MTMQWSQRFPRGGHQSSNRFESLAEESEDESTWSFDTTDDLLHLIDTMESEDEFSDCNEGFTECNEEEAEDTPEWLISCYGKGCSYYDVGLKSQLFFSENDLTICFGEEETMSEITSVHEASSLTSQCFGGR